MALLELGLILLLYAVITLVPVAVYLLFNRFRGLPFHYLRLMTRRVVDAASRKRDYWLAYRGRKSLHTTEYVEQPSFRRYRLGSFSVSKLLKWQYCIGSNAVTVPLHQEEIHLRSSHIKHSMDRVYVYRSECAACAALIPGIGCFMGGRYYCLQCLYYSVLSPFCSERLLLLWGILPQDLERLIVGEHPPPLFRFHSDSLATQRHVQVTAYGGEYGGVQPTESGTLVSLSST
jgi:hypothetical protein